METTTVKKDDLLKKLRANRDEHEKEYLEALKVWKKKSTKELVKAAKRAEEKGEINQAPLADLPKPSHYLRSYDVVIGRLEMEVSDEVQLDAQEFQSWVMNDWNWRGAFHANTSLYNG